MRRLILLPVFILIVAIGLYVFASPLTIQTANPSPVPSTIAEQAISYTAKFTIITDSVTRNFTNPKYHRKSDDVFLLADDPSVIHIKKDSVTWADFFATLPMQLTKDCLVTGDGETFCNKTHGNLTFTLNNIEDNSALEKVIKPDEHLVVRFNSY